MPGKKKGLTPDEVRTRNLMLIDMIRKRLLMDQDGDIVVDAAWKEREYVDLKNRKGQTIQRYPKTPPQMTITIKINGGA